MFDVILVMAGSGERSGLPYNKNLYKIKNKPLFRYSMDLFLHIPQCHKIIMVVNKKDFSVVRDAVIDVETAKFKVVLGGPRRQDSVAKGIKQAETDMVLIHDAARPLLTEDMIYKLYDKSQSVDCAVLAVKAIDTVYRFNSKDVELLNRDELWHIQTPQAIRLSLLKKAFDIAVKENLTFTDDVGMLIKQFGIKPEIVEGSYDNIKVTYERDLRIVEYMIERGYYGI